MRVGFFLFRKKGKISEKGNGRKLYAKAIASRFGLEGANECSTPVDTTEEWSTRPNDTPSDENAKQTYQVAKGLLIQHCGITQDLEKV